MREKDKKKDRSGRERGREDTGVGEREREKDEKRDRSGKRNRARER